MAVTLNANTSTGFIATSDTSGVLQLQTGGTAAVTVDASQNVGIGTASPSYKLDVSGNVSWLPGVTGAPRGYLSGASADQSIEVGSSTNSPFGIATNAVRRMTIDSSGNVGIGTISPSGKLHVAGTAATALTSFYSSGTTTSYNITYIANTSGSAYYGVESSAGGSVFTGTTAYATVLGSGTATSLQFATNNSVKATIDTSGNLLVGKTASGAAGNGFWLDNSGAIVTTIATSNTYHVYSSANSTYRFYVNVNGGISNFSANNVNLSDERVKKNIELSGNYLAKICAIPVKLFNYKDETEGEQRTLGVIAQDVEAVAPELVNNDGWVGEEPEDGVPLKTIYQTDLQYALMKCIQEQQALIQTLTDRITALEGAK